MNTLKTAQLAALAICASLTLPVAAQTIAMETAGAGSVLGLMPQGMAPDWSKAGVSLQLATGQTLTKSLLKMSKGSLDAAVVPPTAFAALKKGVGPYSSLGDKGRHWLATSARCLALALALTTWSYGRIQAQPSGTKLKANASLLDRQQVQRIL